MSSEANRHRLRSSDLFKIIHQDYNLIFSIVKVKVAFGYDDDNEKADNQEILDTIHNTIVEVILENDILCWTTVTGESHDDICCRKSIIRDNTYSVNLQDVFAISPIHTHWNWSLNVNENVAGTTVSITNAFSSSVVPPSATLS